MSSPISILDTLSDRDEDGLGPIGTNGTGVKGLGAPRRPSVHGRARSDVFGDALDLADPVSLFFPHSFHLLWAMRVDHQQFSFEMCQLGRATMLDLFSSHSPSIPSLQLCHLPTPNFTVMSPQCLQSASIYLYSPIRGITITTFHSLYRLKNFAPFEFPALPPLPDLKISIPQRHLLTFFGSG